MTGIQLAARYALMPNKLSFSKAEDIDRVLFDYCCGKGDEKHVQRILRSSSGYANFMNIIAARSGKKVDSPEVIEAYWVGNSLLDALTADDLREMIRSKVAGLDPKVAEELIEKIPDGVVPHHSFHVLHIHAMTGNQIMYGKVNLCTVQSGIVREIQEDHLMIDQEPLDVESATLGPVERVQVKYDKEFLPNVQVGGIVALHWEMAIDLLTPKQAASLKKYTLQNLQAMRSIS